MSDNPNPSRITDAMWQLWQELHALEPDDCELGGIYANKSGYHNTRTANDARWPGNYSVRDAVDRRGPADKAAAIDWIFRSAQNGDYTTIRVYSARLMASGKDRDDPRLDGWREWYGNVDGDRHVDGWDCRYLREISSDRSHLWHIHFSETRELVEDWANKDALLSVLRGESVAAWRARTNGQPAPTAVPEPPPAPEPDRLDEDGQLGPATIARWQQIMGTPVDGVISPTSDLVIAVQRRLNDHGAGLAVDGQGIRQDGRRYQTVRALQRYLGTPQDGVLSPGFSQAVAALQQRLNAGWF